MVYTNSDLNYSNYSVTHDITFDNLRLARVHDLNNTIYSVDGLQNYI